MQSEAELWLGADVHARKACAAALAGALFFSLSAVVVPAHGSGLNQNPEASKPPETREAVNGKPLSVDFLSNTRIGRTIKTYLGCIDFDCPEKSRAVVALGPDAVPPLLQLLQHGVAPEVAAELPGDVLVLARLRAIQVLGALDDTRAIGPLIDAIQDPNSLVRAEAALALGQFRGKDAALIALIPLLQDPDPLVREMTISALAVLGRSEALTELHKALDLEPQAHIRSAIEKAIQLLEQH